jgi:competence/damage-inducible protein CinA-like protein
MPSAEIITIGTELLLGDIVDTNARFLARSLRDVGIDLFRKTTVGDNVNRIAKAIQLSLDKCDIVITTGGLGPTVDDPTREAVALAVGVNSEFRPELWEQIQTRFSRLGRLPTENNRRQAYVPKGAIAIENPVGTAPIFILEHHSHLIISLPGVPREMEYLMQHAIIPYLRQQYDLHTIIKSRVLHTVGIGESQIDDLISDLEVLSNPTVGLAAHSGQLDVRITVKAESDEESAALISPVEKILRNRLGDCIYGVDQESLEQIAMQSIESHHWTLAVIEAGLNGYLLRRLAEADGPFMSGQVLTRKIVNDDLFSLTDQYRLGQKADVGFGVALQSTSGTFDIDLVLISPLGKQQIHRQYGGPPQYAPLWVFNQSLDMIRRIPHDS